MYQLTVRHVPVVLLRTNSREVLISHVVPTQEVACRLGTDVVMSVPRVLTPVIADKKHTMEYVQGVLLPDMDP